ncbi:MAG: hypothetical protein HQL32_03825 [Planctomycetes bacterium]|nr:hypothetical protein [Planctomycetota bacterium]
MHRILSFLLLIISSNLFGQEAKHIFVCVDNHKSEYTVYYVNEFEPTKNWTFKTPKKPRDLQLWNDNRTVLVSQDNGAIELDIATGQPTGFKITGHRGVTSARRLKDGRILIGGSGKIKLLDAQGEFIRNIPLPKTPKAEIRLMEVSENNTLFYSCTSPYCLVEIDLEGQVLQQVPLPQKGYKQYQIENGNFLVSGGPAASLYEIDNKGKIINTWGGKNNFPELQLWDCSGWDQLDNGNIVMTCWHGHGYKGSGPDIVEFNADNQALWSWNSKEAKYLTNVLVIK